MHFLTTLQARIQAPAPAWEGEAVVEGKIATISSSDYKGAARGALDGAHTHRRKIPCAPLLPAGLVRL